MSDARKALVSLIDAQGIADAIQAAGWTPPGERVQCDHERAAREMARVMPLSVADTLRMLEAAAKFAPPTVTPSVEDVARALWELAEQEADTTGGAIDAPWSALDSLTQGLYRADAEDLLALIPGRAETEVKAEAWGEVADYLDRTNAPSLAEAARRDNPYRKEAEPGGCPECGDTMCRCGIDWTAPVTPDSSDIRSLTDLIETAMTDDGHRMPRDAETRYLAHVAAQTALAAVGQGVTAACPVCSMGATDGTVPHDPSDLRCGHRAAVRPSGQEQVDD